MDWQQRFLAALQAARPAYDEPPDWRAALSLYEGLSTADAAALDETVIAMIDEDYRNPHGTAESLPFEDVLTGLPAGMRPDDLLCIEAAVLVAAERRLGAALFAFNRLMRAPRWHALYPRLLWLGQVGFTLQQRLADTRAGRYLGALLGAAVGEALQQDQPEGAAQAEELARTLPQALAPGQDGGAHLDPAWASLVAAYHEAIRRAVHGGASREAVVASAVSVPGPLAAAFGAFLVTDTLEACLTRALEAGGGAAPLAGGLAGAYYGPLALPRRWSMALRGRDEIERQAEHLYALALDPEPKD